MHIDLFEEICYREDCRISFCISRDLHDRLVRNKKDFFCPNGHCQAYTGKTEAQATRELLERERKVFADRIEALHTRNANLEKENRRSKRLLKKAAIE